MTDEISRRQWLEFIGVLIAAGVAGIAGYSVGRTVEEKEAADRYLLGGYQVFNNKPVIHEMTTIKMGEDYLMEVYSKEGRHLLGTLPFNLGKLTFSRENFDIPSILPRIKIDPTRFYFVQYMEVDGISTRDIADYLLRSTLVSDLTAEEEKKFNIEYGGSLYARVDHELMDVRIINEKDYEVQPDIRFNDVKAFVLGVRDISDFLNAV